MISCALFHASTFLWCLAAMKTLPLMTLLWSWTHFLEKLPRPVPKCPHLHPVCLMINWWISKSLCKLPALCKIRNSWSEILWKLLLARHGSHKRSLPVQRTSRSLMQLESILWLFPIKTLTSEFFCVIWAHYVCEYLWLRWRLDLILWQINTENHKIFQKGFGTILKNTNVYFHVFNGIHSVLGYICIMVPLVMIILIHEFLMEHLHCMSEASQRNLHQACYVYFYLFSNIFSHIIGKALMQALKIKVSN